MNRPDNDFRIDRSKQATYPRQTPLSSLSRIKIQRAHIYCLFRKVASVGYTAQSVFKHGVAKSTKYRKHLLTR